MSLLQTVFAVKLIDKKAFNDEKHMTMFRSEVAIMSSIEHPNVVRLYETFEDDVHFYLVMEMIRGGELFDMVSKIKKVAIFSFFFFFLFDFFFFF
jgi:serine/threonine protein kinase